VDEHSPLQPRAHSPRRHRRQDGLQEEPGSPHAPLPQSGAGAAAQLPEGRPVHHGRRGCRRLHDHCPLARVATLFAHPVPAALLQARHQAAHSGARAFEGGLLGQVAPQSVATRSNTNPAATVPE